MILRRSSGQALRQGAGQALRRSSGHALFSRRALLTAAAAAPLAGCKAAPEIPGGFSGISHERGHLLRNPASRFSFVRSEAGAALLFVDGECFDCAAEAAALAELLCAAEQITVAAELASATAALDLLAALFKRGSVAFEPDD